MSLNRNNLIRFGSRLYFCSALMRNGPQCYRTKIQLLGKLPLTWQQAFYFEYYSSVLKKVFVLYFKTKPESFHRGSGREEIYASGNHFCGFRESFLGEKQINGVVHCIGKTTDRYGTPSSVSGCDIELVQIYIKLFLWSQYVAL